MLHNEHLRKSDELYEVRHDNNGEAIHVIIKDGEAIIFPTLWDFIQYYHLGKGDKIERFYLSENELEQLYLSDKYGYYDLKKLAETITSNK